ncbi:ligase [Vibrio sp. UCD-FRSSP16_10]|uniref:PglL family O-oligosaccharyltransferase n=1 Tax=unclassified Vibrio TaxID=2614977 RepID=UPI00080238FD|nr:MULTISPECIES: PglL family O-oligosaccharyltransferase [unclassified Vibrio]OBT17456.1 ligase [Vibrio sp. UCD-FRSSP16_30]OBT23225.1 ligase [Vibrio sp. UCD-FRSSP16_10]
MATLLTTGTSLETKTAKVPFNRRFLLSIGIMFLVAMHFFFPNPGGSGLALSFNPPVWIFLSIVLGIATYQTATNQVIKYSKMTVVLGISCLLMTLPILLPNANVEIALPRITGLWAGFFLFLSFQQFRFSNEEKQRLLWFILIAVAIEAIWGWVQYTLLTPGNPFGYNTVRNRPYGIFQQPNVMASFLATGLVLSGYLLARQPHDKYLSWRQKILFLYAIPLLTVPLLVVLASRTGWLGALLATAMILPYLYRFALKSRAIIWCSLLIAGIVIGLGMGQTGSSESLLSQKADLESARAYTFPQGIDMIIERPLSGYGYGQFESAYMVYTARQHQLNPDYPAGLPSMDHPHNELLMWGIEGGIVPIIAIFLAMGFVLYRLYMVRSGTRIGILALFIPIVLHTQLEYPFYHSAIHWVTFIILLYWVDQRTARYRQFSFGRLSKLCLRSSSLLLPILTCAYMLTALHTNYVLTKFEQSKPKNPDILEQVTNPIAWKDRYEWDIHSTLLNIGIATKQKQHIQAYVDWSLPFIKEKPRPALYKNLIIAYQALDQDQLANAIRGEAKFLFPRVDFDSVSLIKVKASHAVSTTQNSATSKD